MYPPFRTSRNSKCAWWASGGHSAPGALCDVTSTAKGERVGLESSAACLVFASFRRVRSIHQSQPSACGAERGLACLLLLTHTHTPSHLVSQHHPSHSPLLLSFLSFPLPLARPRLFFLARIGLDPGPDATDGQKAPERRRPPTRLALPRGQTPAQTQTGFSRTLHIPIYIFRPETQSSGSSGRGRD